MYDLVVMGAGPAGLTSAIYAVRSGLTAVVLESTIAGGQAATAPFIENYPGFESIKGIELMEKMKKHCMNYCEILENKDVLNAKKSNEGFLIETADERYESRALIIATGAKHKKLNVKGEEEFIGKGVSYCATCDGFFFKNRRVLVIGGGNTAAADALYLNSIGAKVRVIHRSAELRADKVLQQRLASAGINVLYGKRVEEIKGKERVEKVLLSDGTELECDGVFVSAGIDPNNEMAHMLGVKLDDLGYVITDGEQRTNMPFVYAAGDITRGMKQVVVACAQGAIAANSAYVDLKNPYWAEKDTKK